MKLVYKVVCRHDDGTLRSAVLSKMYYVDGPNPFARIYRRFRPTRTVDVNMGLLCFDSKEEACYFAKIEEGHVYLALAFKAVPLHPYYYLDDLVRGKKNPASMSYPLNTVSFNTVILLKEII